MDSHPVESKYLKRFVLRADTLKHKNLSYRVTGSIRVSAGGPGPDIAKGDRVVFQSRLREIRNFNNPGGFNYQRSMAFQKIWRSAYTQGSRLKVVHKNSARDLPQQVHDARMAMAALIDRAGKQQPGAVLKALIIGDRSAISTEAREAFNRAGVGHILAISGLHIGIVATAAFIFFQKLLSLIKPLLWHAWTRKGAAILSLFPVCIYGLISGMSPSTQRAVIMVIAFLMTFLVEREIDLDSIEIKRYRYTGNALCRFNTVLQIQCANLYIDDHVIIFILLIRIVQVMHGIENFCLYTAEFLNDTQRDMIFIAFAIEFDFATRYQCVINRIIKY